MSDPESDVSELAAQLRNVEKRLEILNSEVAVIKQKLFGAQNKIANKNKRAAVEEIDAGVKHEIKKERTDFTLNENFVVVYTDGACENNGRPNAKAGIGVWFGDEHPLNVSKPVQGKATNNVAEIQACVAALRIATENNIKRLCIKTDSQFVINSMTKWINRWKKNNWTLSTGGAVKNKEDFVKLSALCDQVTVKWEYVAGHSGITGNEKADSLAREGAMLYR